MPSSLLGIINNFYGGGSYPLNLQGYNKMGAYAGWYGGVAEHDNNSAIPYSKGSLRISQFASPADKNFISDNWTQGITSYVDGYTGEYWVANGIATQNGLYSAGFYNLSAIGSAGSRTVVGKSTYGSAGQTAQVIGVYDWNQNGTEGFIIQMAGDQRRTGWGGAGAATAPVAIVINSATRNFGSAYDANGFYDSYYNITTWSWLGSPVGLSGSGSTSFTVSIF